MELKERRASERFATLNFIHYVLDDCGDGDMESMGRTLDASERGLLIQTSDPLPVGHKLCLSVGLAEDIVELSGEIIHCVEDSAGMYSTGIEFAAMDERQLDKLKTYLTAFAAAKQQ